MTVAISQFCAILCNRMAGEAQLYHVQEIYMRTQLQIIMSIQIVDVHLLESFQNSQGFLLARGKALDFGICSLWRGGILTAVSWPPWKPDI